jgi:hypothetical protein
VVLKNQKPVLETRLQIKESAYGLRFSKNIVDAIMELISWGIFSASERIHKYKFRNLIATQKNNKRIINQQ